MASSIINSDDGSVSGTTGLKTTGGDDGALEIQSVGTKYMTVAAGGDISFYEDTGTTAKFFWDASAERLGIGTTSPTYPLNVQTTGSTYIGSTAGDTSIAGLLLGKASNKSLGRISYDNSTNALQLWSNGTERMRIDSSGNLLVGTTSSVTGSTGGAEFRVEADDRNTLYLGTTSTASRAVAGFVNPNGTVGSITVTGSSTAYSTSSDYRLKEDWQPMSGSIDRLKALNPVNFAWKVDGTRVDGFLAHEAAEVVPEAVSGEKDAVEAIGNVTDAEGTVVQENVPEPEELSEGQTWTKTEDRPVYQGIDQSKLTPLLTAALQDTIKLVEDLQAEVAALKAQLNG